MSQPLWTLPEILAATGGRLIGEPVSDVSGISIDTRTLEPGDAYFAIKGDARDGHEFVGGAAKAGASVSIVAEAKLDTLEKNHGNLVVVDDVLTALEALGRASRERSQAQIIAITGSVGKTTTKEALRTALAASGKTHASVASYNNHWGVPLTLARMPRDCEFGIFEVGMNHPGEISPLVKMVQPHVAIINNVAAVHLGAFDSVDDIARAKAEIFDGVVPNGSVLLNADDQRLPLLTEIADAVGISNIHTFGEAENANVKAEQIVMHSACTCLTATVFDEKMVVKIGSPGRHIAQNALAVLGAVKLTGGDLAKAGLALAEFKPVKGRGQRHRIGEDDNSFLLIDESYNANPTSMKAALDLLGATEVRGRGQRIAVLGDMLELGEQSADFHAGLADSVEANEVDQVFLVGPEMASLDVRLKGHVNCHHVDQVEDVLPLVRASVKAGDVIMAKASLGIRFAVLIEDLLRGNSDATAEQ